MDDRATKVTLNKGQILGDQTTTTAVKYLDCSALVAGADWCFVRVVCTVAMYAVAVEATSPATTPTITATSGAAAMDYFPAGVAEHFMLTKANPVLAYSADAGILRVRKASP